jgi:hypothetical protein
MYGDKLSKNGLDKPENERETKLIKPTTLVIERGVMCLENGVANHMDKEARQIISREQRDGGNERSGTHVVLKNYHVETTKYVELFEEEDEHHIENMERNAVTGGACGGIVGFDEKSLIKSRNCPCTESRDVASSVPKYFHIKKGCGGVPLGFARHHVSCFWAATPHTPQFEEPKVVWCNHGIKQWFPSNPYFFFPVCSILVQLCIKCTDLVIGIIFMGGAGDESDDCLPKHIRVRSIASVYGNVSQPIQGAL